MKKHGYAYFILLLTLTAPDVFPTADGPDYWRVHGVESNDVLNIRQEANARSEKVGSIPSTGQCIKNIRCVGGLTFDEFTNLSQDEKDKIIRDRPRWCYVGYKGTEGWVAGRYLREGICEAE